MKKILMFGFVMISGLSLAQSVTTKSPKNSKSITQTVTTDKNGKTKVTIQKNINGKVETEEKFIDNSDLATELDTSDVSEMTHKEIIEERVYVNEMDTADDMNDMERDAMEYSNRNRNRNGRGGATSEFDYHMQRLSDKLSDLPNHFRPVNPNTHYMTTNNNTTIKGLDVYPNTPENHIINVKFFAPEKGDVSITVMDLEGNVIIKKVAKAIIGEYMGQVVLPQPKKGTIFVIVAQNGDGISRKIKLF